MGLRPKIGLNPVEGSGMTGSSGSPEGHMQRRRSTEGQILPEGDVKVDRDHLEAQGVLDLMPRAQGDFEMKWPRPCIRGFRADGCERREISLLARLAELGGWNPSAALT